MSVVQGQASTKDVIATYACLMLPLPGTGMKCGLEMLSCKVVLGMLWSCKVELSWSLSLGDRKSVV